MISSSFSFFFFFLPQGRVPSFKDLPMKRSRDFSFTHIYSTRKLLISPVKYLSNSFYFQPNLGNKMEFQLTEKEGVLHSSTLAWKIPWTEELGKLQSMGSLRVRLDWATSLSLFTFMHWWRKWQRTPVLLPGKSHGLRSLVSCHLWGRRVGHDWSDLAVAAAI